MIYASLLLRLGAICLPGYVAATELILAQDGAKPMDGKYIVTLVDPPGAKSMSQDQLDAIIQSEAAGIVSAAKGTVDLVYTSALHGFAATLDDEALKKVLNHPSVASVEQDGEVWLDQSVTWGLDRIDDLDLPRDNNYSPTFGNGGEGVTAYILDTGILTTHEEFGGRAVHGDNFVGDGQNTDCHGHGTHVAGTVGSKTYGVAPNVKLVGVKVLSCGGSGTWSGVIAGVNWVKQDVENKGITLATANMSLGGGKNIAVNNAVKNLVASGVSTVVAAGNWNRDACNYSPAGEPDAITVGSTDSADKRSSFSNWGSCVDIFAPGSNIEAPVITNPKNKATGIKSGTSMASPHVCGAAALYLNNNPNLTPDKLLDEMLDDAVDDTITDVKSPTNKFLYVGADKAPTPPTTPPPTGAPTMVPTTPTSSFGPTPSSYGTGTPTKEPSGTITPAPTLAPTDLPSADPTSEVDCTELKKKKECKMFDNVCVYGKRKIDGECVAKRRVKHDCEDYNDESTCVDSSEEKCKWENNVCVSICSNLPKQECKELKYDKKRACKATKMNNPCAKCNPRSECDV